MKSQSLKKTYRHGFIGIGKMGQTVLRGLLGSGAAVESEILVSQPFPEESRAFRKNFKTHLTHDNREAAKRSRILWLGVKPYQAKEVLESIGSSLTAGSLIISFMAGVSVAFIRRRVGKKVKVIRAMPNTPGLLGQGMTGVYFPKDVDRAARGVILKILERLGPVESFAKESDLDAVTGLSGSGPAFVYELARGLIEGGVASGLKSAEARLLAVQTLIGAARMIQETQDDLAQLIRNVATPGGTTEAGLKVMKKRKLSEGLAETVRAASRRAREIREENDRCSP